MPNSGSYITYGRIYEENKDYVETYKIPKVCVAFLKEKKLKDKLNVKIVKIDKFCQNLLKLSKLSKF